jgi:hypothetical protein
MKERDQIDERSGAQRESARSSRDEKLSLLQTITMEVAAASDVASALEVVLRRVCEKTGWVLGQACIFVARGGSASFLPGPAQYRDLGPHRTKVP